MLEDKLDIKNLYEKKKQIHSFGLYSDADVVQLAEAFFKYNGDKEKILEKDETKALSFRTDLSRFVSYYEKITQVTRHWDVNLHYEYLYCLALLKVLPFGTVQHIDIKKYIALPSFFVDTVKDVFDGAIELEQDKGELTGGGIGQ